jgi:ATP-binding cassette subfamily F protein uup
VTIDGQPRHVSGYLRDFLFPPERLRAPVSMLSGGERNRLLLARLFARPSNLLVMDEPTNDLDAETLDLLEEMVANYAGTLLLVSHDRAFLDNVVTSTLVFEGNGRVQEYVGGYGDWLRQRQPEARSAKSEPRGSNPEPRAPSAVRVRGRKLSYKEQRELEALPGRIEALEAEQRALNLTIAGPEFYKEGAGAIDASLARVDELQRQLTDAYARWDELESRRA